MQPCNEQGLSADSGASTSRAAESPLGVIINYQSWLPLTENWIYSQARHLPPTVTPYVVCGNTGNLDQFPMEHLFSYADLRRFERLRVLTRGAFRLGTKLGRRSALMAEVVHRYGARVVHSHFGYTGYHSAPAVRRLGLAHVVTFYGVDMSAMPASDPRWIDRYQELFADVDKVLCEGPVMADRVCALGCPVSKVQVHHLGVDLEKLPFQPRRWKPGTRLRVLIASSFREKKGIPVAIHALAKLRKIVPLQITIIGDAGNHDKAQAEKLRILRAVDHTGLSPDVTYMGYQLHSVLLTQAYEHHVYLAASMTASDGDTEGGAPITLIEMAATGMPVVSTRHADIPAVLEHGVSGLLADEGQVDQLLEQLRWLVENPDAWEALAVGARRRIDRDFNATIQGMALAEIYTRMVRQADRSHH